MHITIRIPHMVIALTLALLLHALILSIASRTLIQTSADDAASSWRPPRSGPMSASAPLALIPWEETPPPPPPPPPAPLLAQAEPQPEPPPTQPKREEIPLGLDDGAAKAENSWVGFKEPTEHHARRSEVAQPQLDPNANNSPQTSETAGGTPGSGSPTPSKPAPMPTPAAQPPAPTAPSPNPSPSQPTTPPTPTPPNTADPSDPQPPTPTPSAPAVSPPQRAPVDATPAPLEGTPTGNAPTPFAPTPSDAPLSEEAPAAPRLPDIPGEPTRPDLPVDPATHDFHTLRPRGIEDATGTEQTTEPERKAVEESTANPKLPIDEAARKLAEFLEQAAPSDQPESVVPAPSPQPPRKAAPIEPAPPATPAPPDTKPSPAISPDQPGAPVPGKGGAGGVGGEQSDKQTDASALEEPIKIRPGRTVAAKGLEIVTRRPVFSKVTRVVTSPDNPIIQATFGRDGTVIRAKILKTSGYTDVDQPVLDAVYSWRARGEALRKLPTQPAKPFDPDEPTLPPGVVLEFTILLR